MVSFIKFFGVEFVKKCERRSEMGADEEEEQIQGSSLSSHFDRIFVSVRLRPLNEKEIAKHDVLDWECINDNTIMYRNSLSVAERLMYPIAYTFDRVFSGDCTTRKVYEEAAKEVALSVVGGINSSVFAYGQTSSGKTFTMSGITEYTMADIYEYIEKHKEREFILKFSAMEIYNESVRDLLIADITPLRLLDDPERGTIVEKLTEETLKDWSHLRKLLSICEAQRQIGETSLNETSSRAHQILRLTVESSAREFLSNDPRSLTATVNFVDLAGSERASHALSTGPRLKEGCHINRSLLTLGTVVRKLSKGRNGHVPFRDSKLTRILQSSLGGNARTAIICTMSPARIHVEQSRNTLLFASCAKEVTTNAQVNIVMSDKMLVKHLQRELARLENELKSSGTTFMSPDSAAVMREKDRQIQQLEKEVVELTMQRDLAQSQVEVLQRGAANGSNDRPPVASLDNQYPKLRVRSSWDFENLKIETQTLGNPHSLDISVRTSDASQCSGGHSRSSSDEIFFQIPDLEKDFPDTQSYVQDEVSVPNFIRSDLLEEIGERNNENVEDLYNYKDVQCIELEESTIRDADSNKSESIPKREGDLDLSSADLNTDTSGLTKTENEGGQNGELRLPNLKKQKDWKNILLDSVIPSASTSLKLTRSKSCKAGLMTNLSSYKLANNEKTPPTLFEKDFTGRPGGVQKKFSVLKYAVDSEDLSTNDSLTSADSTALQNVGTSDCLESTSCSMSFARMEEMIDPRDKNQLADHEEMQSKSVVVPAKSVRDVGLDPIQHWEWPFDFKRLQRQIIELWHACNISLVHRTYFFLLFKGDHKDSVYMEVELRRLIFLKNAFSLGNQAVEDGRTVTSASSMEALRQERHMLSYQLKNFSKEQRQNLFLKWGIGLQTKHRGWQLANLLWSDTKDMNHIAESAAIVSKVVTFVKPEQAFKEMFGLSFAPRRPSSTKKLNLWKRGVMSIL